jgi:hypothetical protein
MGNKKKLILLKIGMKRMCGSSSIYGWKSKDFDSKN